MALTAAWCSLNLMSGPALVWLGSHTSSLLSLPPDAKYWLSLDHLSPHTSCLCPISSPTYGSFTRTSRMRILRSRLPDASTKVLEANVPTRCVWPGMVRTRRHA